MWLWIDQFTITYAAVSSQNYTTGSLNVAIDFDKVDQIRNQR